MADRGRGRGSNNNRGGGVGSRGNQTGREAKAPILALAKYGDTQVRVKFAGGREVTGTLKGYDALLNLVLDEVEEDIRDPETSQLLVPTQKRALGLVILRGTALVIISPVEGMEEIANPFAQE